MRILGAVMPKSEGRDWRPVEASSRVRRLRYGLGISRLRMGLEDRLSVARSLLSSKHRMGEEAKFFSTRWFLHERVASGLCERRP